MKIAGLCRDLLLALVGQFLDHLFRLDFAPGRSPLRSDADDQCVVSEHLGDILRVFGSEPTDRPGTLLMRRIRNEVRLPTD